MRLTTFALATACALLSVPAFAQAQSPTPARSAPQTTGVAPATETISTPDFVNKLVMGDMFDVRSARIAEQKGDSSDKGFARREIPDHSKLTDDMKAMVSSGKVQASIPAGLDSEHQQRLDQLQKLSGKQFDDAYNRDERQNHENMVNLLQQYAQNGSNSDLKQWAAKTLPEVKQHLSNADKLK